jgi:small subunit ribosomal protein S8
MFLVLRNQVGNGEIIMSMQDPIADMITIIRNGQRANKLTVDVPASRYKLSIVKVLEQEGFIQEHSVEGESAKKIIKIKLKYYDGKAVISQIDKVSRPGLRIFKKKEQLPKVKGGLGISIISTSKGMKTDKEARAVGIGGEIICNVS